MAGLLGRSTHLVSHLDELLAHVLICATRATDSAGRIVPLLRQRREGIAVGLARLGVLVQRPSALSGFLHRVAVGGSQPGLRIERRQVHASALVLLVDHALHRVSQLVQLAAVVPGRGGDLLGGLARLAEQVGLVAPCVLAALHDVAHVLEVAQEDHTLAAEVLGRGGDPPQCLVIAQRRLLQVSERDPQLAGTFGRPVLDQLTRSQIAIALGQRARLLVEQGGELLGGGVELLLLVHPVDQERGPHGQPGAPRPADHVECPSKPAPQRPACAARSGTQGPEARGHPARRRGELRGAVGERQGRGAEIPILVSGEHGAQPHSVEAVAQRGEAAGGRAGDPERLGGTEGDQRACRGLHGGGEPTEGAGSVSGYTAGIREGGQRLVVNEPDRGCQDR